MSTSIIYNIVERINAAAYERTGNPVSPLSYQTDSVNEIVTTPGAVLWDEELDHTPEDETDQANDTDENLRLLSIIDREIGNHIATLQHARLAIADLRNMRTLTPENAQ